MATGTRIYLVTINGKVDRLVRASHPSQALGHVAKGLFEVAVATQDQIVDCVTAGVGVEEANAEPEKMT